VLPYILSIEPNVIKDMEVTYYNTFMFCPIPLGLVGVKKSTHKTKQLKHLQKSLQL
jgi:hypothetical protein